MPNGFSLLALSFNAFKTRYCYFQLSDEFLANARHWCRHHTYCFNICKQSTTPLKARILFNLEEFWCRDSRAVYHAIVLWKLHQPKSDCVMSHMHCVCDLWFTYNMHIHIQHKPMYANNLEHMCAQSCTMLYYFA